MTRLITPPRRRKPEQIRQSLEAYVGKLDSAAAIPDGKVAEDLGKRHGLECAILGCMLLDVDAIPVVRAKTRTIPLSDLFASARHGMIAEAVFDLDENGELVDYTTTCLWLERHYPAWTPWPAHVVGTEPYVFSTRNIDWYCDKLLDFVRREKAWLTGFRLQEAVENPAPLNTVIETESEALKELISTRAAVSTPTEAAADRIIATFSESADSTNEVGIRWYWPKLNMYAGVLRRRTAHVLHAPPGTGKTIMAMQQAEYAAEMLKMNVLAVLMESDEDQIFSRHAMRRWGVDGRNVTARTLNPQDRAGMESARTSWGELGERTWISYSDLVNGDEIDAMVHEWRSTTGRKLDLLIIDHLNTMTSALPGVLATDHSAISHNFMRLVQVARRENCALLVLAQPKKETYSGHRARPTLGDIKGSGTPIESAKQIIALHIQETERRDQVIARGEIVVVKANDGSTKFFRSLFVQPAAMHIEDTPQNRALYAELFERYGGAPAHQAASKSAGAGRRFQPKEADDREEEEAMF